MKAEGFGEVHRQSTEWKTPQGPEGASTRGASFSWLVLEMHPILFLVALQVGLLVPQDREIILEVDQAKLHVALLLEVSGSRLAVKLDNCQLRWC